MKARGETTRYRVRLSVPRRGGWRAWGAASGDFEERLAAQDSPGVAGPQIETQTRRGADYVRVTIAAAVIAADVAEALTVAWGVFLQAADDDAHGWDMASATAEVRPERLLTGHRALAPQWISA